MLQRMFKYIKFYCICESTDDIVDHHSKMSYHFKGLLPILASGQAFK